MDNRILAEDIVNSIALSQPTIRTLWGHVDMYEEIVDLVKEVIDRQKQLDNLEEGRN
jgi:transcription elongation factor Elf1